MRSFVVFIFCCQLSLAVADDRTISTTSFSREEILSSKAPHLDERFQNNAKCNSLFGTLHTIPEIRTGHTLEVGEHGFSYQAENKTLKVFVTEGKTQTDRTVEWTGESIVGPEVQLFVTEGDPAPKIWAVVPFDGNRDQLLVADLNEEKTSYVPIRKFRKGKQFAASGRYLFHRNGEGMLPNGAIAIDDVMNNSKSESRADLITGGQTEMITSSALIHRPDESLSPRSGELMNRSEMALGPMAELLPALLAKVKVDPEAIGELWAQATIAKDRALKANREAEMREKAAMEREVRREKEERERVIRERNKRIAQIMEKRSKKQGDFKAFLSTSVEYGKLSQKQANNLQRMVDGKVWWTEVNHFMSDNRAKFSSAEYKIFERWLSMYYRHHSEFPPPRRDSAQITHAQATQLREAWKKMPWEVQRRFPIRGNFVRNSESLIEFVRSRKDFKDIGVDIRRYLPQKTTENQFWNDYDITHTDFAN